jgi:hypothetical protein
MESEASLSSSQEFATGPCPKHNYNNNNNNNNNNNGNGKGKVVPVL